MKSVVSYIAQRIILPEGHISISFVTNEQIRELNHSYRGKDKATDVLTFNLLEDEIVSDIYLAREVILSNAKRYKVMYGHELKRVIAHCFAHVIGYDHRNARELKLIREYEDFLLLGFESLNEDFL